MLRKQCLSSIRVHIWTGGGSLKYEITNYPADSFRPEFMNEIIKRADLSQKEAFATFNMGVGFVVTVKNLEQAQQFFKAHGEEMIVLGKVSKI